MEQTQGQQPVSVQSDKSPAVWAMAASIILAVAAVVLRVMSEAAVMSSEAALFLDLAWFAVIAAAVIGAPALHEYLRRS